MKDTRFNYTEGQKVIIRWNNTPGNDKMENMVGQVFEIQTNDKTGSYSLEINGWWFSPSDIEPYELRIGDTVEAIDESAGWGTVNRGDIGKIVTAGCDIYSADFENQSDWVGTRRCFKLIQPVSGSNYKLQNPITISALMSAAPDCNQWREEVIKALKIYPNGIASQEELDKANLKDIWIDWLKETGFISAIKEEPVYGKGSKFELPNGDIMLLITDDDGDLCSINLTKAEEMNSYVKGPEATLKQIESKFGLSNLKPIT